MPHQASALSDFKQISRVRWPAWVMIWTSVLITLMLLGFIRVWIMDSHGIADTTTEHAIFFAGLYLALPCGILSIVGGIRALSKGLMKKRIAILGILIGVFIIFIGIASWTWFFMVTAFAKAFS